MYLIIHAGSFHDKLHGNHMILYALPVLNGYSNDKFQFNPLTHQSATVKM